jgi:hypothetical protein
MGLRGPGSRVSSPRSSCSRYFQLASEIVALRAYCAALHSIFIAVEAGS